MTRDDRRFNEFIFTTAHGVGLAQVSKRKASQFGCSGRIRWREDGSSRKYGTDLNNAPNQVSEAPPLNQGGYR